MSVLQQLHYIKGFREKKAETDMVKNKWVLAQAKAREESSRHDLQTHKAFALQEELRMYRQLCERVVRLRDITRVQEEVLVMQARTREHLAQVAAAEQAHAQARDVFDASWAHYRAATNAREKFEELLRQQAMQLLKETERREESEMEELAGNLHDRQDFEEYSHA